MASTGFVVGFGGTGARVLEACGYLAATGYPEWGMHLLMIDPDRSNGNVVSYEEQATRYQSIHAQIASGGEGYRKSLFAVPLNAACGKTSLAWDYPQSNMSFDALLNMQQHPDAARLFELLYDQDDMRASFGKGYVGRAHVGALDLYRVLEGAANAARQANPLTASPDGLQLFLQQVSQAAATPEGASITVVGSVFGGTGASGLPAFPVFLDRALPANLRKNVRVQAILIGPYFGIPAGNSGAPDSSLHALSTRTALYHYGATAVGYDRMYLLGAPSQVTTSDLHSLGGQNQSNGAHYVELVAALAADHAMRHPVDSSRGPGAAREVMASPKDVLEWNSLPTALPLELQRRFAVLSTFAAFHATLHAPDLERRYHTKAKWYQDLTAARNRTLGGSDAEVSQLTRFTSQFMAWMASLSRHADGALFRVGDRAAAETMESLMGEPARPGEGFHAMIEGLDRAAPIDAETGLGWYVRAATAASTRWCETNYADWWGK